MQTYYHTDYLDSNGVIELHSGEYEHQDHAWCCEHSSEWYSNDEDSVVVKDSDGDEITIHPKYADEYNTNEGEE